MLNRRGESRLFILFPVLGARYSALCHQEMLPVIFSYLSFIRLMKFPSMPSLLSLFYCEGRLALATIFSAPFEMICDFSFFSLIIWWIALIDFWILNQSGIPLINLNLLWCSGSDGKVSCLQCGRPRSSPWVGKISWRRKWQPTPVFLPGKSHGRRSVVGYSPWCRKESDTTERLHFHLIIHFIYSLI